MQTEVVAQIVIAMDNRGQINVNGPLENKLLMLGLLECAKETVIEFSKKAQQNIVQPPPGFTLPKQ